jgi:hypothetical protein
MVFSDITHGMHQKMRVPGTTTMFFQVDFWDIFLHKHHRNVRASHY